MIGVDDQVRLHSSDYDSNQNLLFTREGDRNHGY